MRRFLVGLGNPGKEYSETRHNLGFMTVEKLSSRLSIRLRPGKGDYLIGKGKAEGRESVADIHLVKPLTFVNSSGVAVIDLIERYDLDSSDVLIICDDANLPLGKIRLRQSGSDGGHKGLQSIIYHLQTEQFSRLRIGIGRPGDPELTDFVLGEFSSDELELAREAVGRASDAAVCWAVEGIEKAMSIYNQ